MKKDAAYWDWLARDLEQTANDLMSNDWHGIWLAQAKSLESYDRWWSLAFEQSEEEREIIDAAARELAQGRQVPEISLAQTGRLALRFRLASRIARALGRHCTIDRKGWFPTRLGKMGRSEVMEWLLITGWQFWAEILDETLLWGSELPRTVREYLLPPPEAWREGNDSFPS